MANRYDSTRQWYAIHTYSGYEEKVADSIRQRINAVDMADKIFDVMVPKEKQIQIKNGKRKVVESKIFQGYALVEMKLTDETWYIVRNTPGVTGFVGSGTEPTPVSDAEIAKIKKRMGVEDPKHHIDFSEGEVVSIVDGPFKGFEGSISEIDNQKGKVKVMVSMFGRDTSVELDALQVSKDRSSLAA
jgi:transcriptional antiterminator NusG